MIFDKFFYYFKNAWSSKKDLIKKLLSFCCVVLIILFSGYSFTVFAIDTKTEALLSIGLVASIGLLWLLNLDLTKIKRIIKAKKFYTPSVLTIFCTLILFFLLISFIFNGNKGDNVFSYIGFGIVILVSYFIVKTVSIEYVASVFKKSLTIISLIGIVFFALVYVTKWTFPTSYFFGKDHLFGNYFFLNFDFNSGLTYTYSNSFRLGGIFWEPGVFGTFLLFGLFVNSYFKDKFYLFRIVLFTVCIICTFSTSAFILYFFWLLFEMNLRLKKKVALIIDIAFVAAVALGLIFFDPIIDFLAKIMPSVFSKVQSGGESFNTRIYSLGYYFDIFLKNPFVGFGGNTANTLYYASVDTNITASTSTYGMALASFGIAGIVYYFSHMVGIIFNQKFTKLIPQIIFLIFVLLVTNSQNHSQILALNIIYFYTLKDVSLPKILQRKNDKILALQPEEKPLLVKDVVFSQQEGGIISRNILLSFALKGIAIIVSFITIPIYLMYFSGDKTIYGVWLAIASVLTIISVFDFGMGNGMKNKLIAAFQNKDDKQARLYISTTYCLTALIALGLVAIFGVVIFSVPSSALLSFFFKNAPAPIDPMIFRVSLFIVIFGICVEFVLKNLSFILQARGNNAITGAFMLATNAIVLIFAYVFSMIEFSADRIIVLSCVYAFFLNTPFIVVSIILFTGKYKSFRPSFRSVDFKKSSDVAKLGIKFFVVQIGTLIMWGANEFIILAMFTGAEVTEYTVYFKLFSLLLTIFGTVIQQPLWTSIAKYYSMGKKEGVKKLIKACLAISAGFLVINLALTLFLPTVFSLWLGDGNVPVVDIWRQLSFILYSLVFLFCGAFVIPANALGLFKGQLVTAFFCIIVKIPLLVGIFYLNKQFNFGFEWYHIVLLNVAFELPILFVTPFEIKKALVNIPKPEADQNTVGASQ